ncbi:MAG: hypothetical protein U5N55_12450 [Cypionkella sp.]|nr:hypothetical protein [Cypionkella sp.]
MMLWSLVHGYAMLSLTGMTADTGKVIGIEEIMPDFGYLGA